MKMYDHAKVCQQMFTVESTEAQAETFPDAFQEVND